MKNNNFAALYYPFIDIQNEKWLKTALLYWDEIRTIVPESNKNPYTSKFSEELSDDGFLVPLHVSSEMDEIESLTEKVLDWITDPATEDLVFDTPDADMYRIYPEKMPSEFRRLYGNDGPRFGLSGEKIPSAIRDRLRSISTDGNYYFPRNFANFYMTILATAFAERLGLPLVTESNTADQFAVSVAKGKRQTPQGRFGRAYEAFGPRELIPQQVVQSLIVETAIESFAIPDSIPLKKLKKFKADHYEELREFRLEIANLASKIDCSISIDAARQQIHDQYSNKILPALSILKKSARAESWDTGIGGLIKVISYTASPTSVAILAGVPSSIAIAAGAGLTVVATAAKIYNSQPINPQLRPYSYLLSAENVWGPKN